MEIVVAEADVRVQIAVDRASGAERRAMEAEARAERRVREAEERARETEGRAREAERRAGGRAREGEWRPEVRQGELQAWGVEREEIQLTEQELGRGGWATVSVAIFRGARVAAKCIHGEILFEYNRRMFRREMDMAARIRHPNLLLFVGATLEEEMVILTADAHQSEEGVTPDIHRDYKANHLHRFGRGHSPQLPPPDATTPSHSSRHQQC